VKPFATGRLGEGVAGDVESGNEGDGGVDVKWGITSSLLLDASYRTDFSQVEADEQQINLTRFSTFFPEKRQFFLENPGNFQIGLQDARRDFVPYFTRRIGLVGGVPVPVFGGVRLTGQTGGMGVGLLNMQTEDYGAVPGSNYSAIVLRRPLSRTTSAAGFYFGRESAGPEAYNRVAGFDFDRLRRAPPQVHAPARLLGARRSALVPVSSSCLWSPVRRSRKSAACCRANG
jgi:hypothetical protein